MRRIGTKNIREKPERADGLRVLVMTLWPRGIKKGAVDCWLRPLGTPRPLLRQWKGGRISWAEFRHSYLEHLRSKSVQATLKTLVELARKKPVTLLCSCPDAKRCHRSLLAAVVQRRLRTRG